MSDMTPLSKLGTPVESLMDLDTPAPEHAPKGLPEAGPSSEPAAMDVLSLDTPLQEPVQEPAPAPAPVAELVPAPSSAPSPTPSSVQATEAASDLTEAPDVAPAAAPEAPRKPRLAIMGEFSAGKSTLSNLLLGSRPLPEKVTATRLSPVWITEGEGSPMRVGLDGQETPVALEDIQTTPVEDTRYIRMPFQAEILKYCDLLDFPGISDPNMDSDVWERVLDEVDVVLWCTHGTQAWRQSEAAVWDMVPEAVRANSLLLITRFDKLLTERDRARVVHRVTQETGDLFRAIFPISLTRALASVDNPEGWEASGAGPFADHLIELLGDLGQPTEQTAGDETAAPAPTAQTQAQAQTQIAEGVTPLELTNPAVPPAPAGPKITPRRVRPTGRSSRPRPTA